MNRENATIAETAREKQKESRRDRRNTRKRVALAAMLDERTQNYIALCAKIRVLDHELSRAVAANDREKAIELATELLPLIEQKTRANEEEIKLNTKLAKRLGIQSREGG